jgi:hypothetical protein
VADRRGKLRSFTGTFSRPVPIAILIVVLLAIAVIAIVASRTPSSPERTVREFISSRINGDDSKAAKLTVEGSVQGFLGRESSLSDTNTSFNVSVLESDSQSAVVEVHFIQGDQSADVPYSCKHVSGSWKIDLKATEELWMADQND